MKGRVPMEDPQYSELSEVYQQARTLVDLGLITPPTQLQPLDAYRPRFGPVDNVITDLQRSTGVSSRLYVLMSSLTNRQVTPYTLLADALANHEPVAPLIEQFRALARPVDYVGVPVDGVEASVPATPLSAKLYNSLYVLQRAYHDSHFLGQTGSRDAFDQLLAGRSVAQATAEGTFDGRPANYSYTTDYKAAARLRVSVATLHMMFNLGYFGRGRPNLDPPTPDRLHYTGQRLTYAHRLEAQVLALTTGELYLDRVTKLMLALPWR